LARPVVFSRQWRSENFLTAGA